MADAGRTVLVTGAARGLGRCIVDRFAAKGYAVVALDADGDSLSQLDGVAGVTPVLGDITSPADIDRAVTVAGGPITTLVNNAGILDGLTPLDELSDELWQRVLAVNLTGTMNACRRLVPDMITAGGGLILNVASIGGLRGGRAGAAYTASKWAVVGLTQNIATTYAGAGIRCNAICPGSMATSIGIGVEFSERGLAAVAVDTSAPAPADPDRVAAVVALIADDSASFINGAVIPVDGGWIAY